MMMGKRYGQRKCVGTNGEMPLKKIWRILVQKTCTGR